METKDITLGEIAYARSGDKGSNVNIGVIAFNQQGYDFLRHYLTEERVGKYFHFLGYRHVKRFVLPNLWALNFLLEGALEGGGSLSLRTDGQGKALGQAILEMPIKISQNLIRELQEGEERHG